MQNIFAKDNYSAKGAKFVIIDSNGEYNKAFSRLNEINPQVSHSLMIADDTNDKKFEIPVWALSADDWAILLHASEKTQIPVLKRAIDIAKIFYSNGENNNELKNHILASTLLGIINSSDTSPSKADKLKAIISHFGTNEIGMDTDIQGMTLRKGIEISYGSMSNEEKVIKYLTAYLKADIIPETVMGMIVPYSLDDASAEVVTKVLAKLLLDYLKRRANKADMPINFLIEEAHRFVRNETSYGAVGYNIFERIAKEGRKYGMLLGISSQRPSELSKTVVSQCSNFIIHRVQNPDDLQYISKMVPYINQNMIDRLTYLQTGHALVFGSAINLPTLTKFAQAEPRTDSDNAQISEKWYIK